ncbi:MAG: hypothetical protein VYD62_01905, partial [Candidatus Thermoplasmatota archaeon]|nr:hypothetical protein [Candidatus Thermoplasmatota archaeon]
MASDALFGTCECGKEIPVGEGLRSHLEKEMHGELSKSIREEMEDEYKQRLVDKTEEETDQRQVLEAKVKKQREELNGLREHK